MLIALENIQQRGNAPAMQLLPLEASNACNIRVNTAASADAEIGVGHDFCTTFASVALIRLCHRSE